MTIHNTLRGIGDYRPEDDSVQSCSPTDHNFTHGKEKCGPYNRFTMILIYCTKCGNVKFRELV